MAEIDLDLIVKMPVKIKFKGNEYVFDDPPTERIIEHERLVKKFERSRQEIESLVRENDPDKQELIQQKMEEFREKNMYLHKEIFDIFIPGLSEHYMDMTMPQREKVLSIILGEAEKKIEEEEGLPGGK